MHRPLIEAAIVVLLLPAACFALAICVTGNEPQSPENYTQWPGLVDVINDVSRQSLCWVNGDEWLCYRGDTAALNRVLKQFAEVKAEELHLVLLPGPGPGIVEDVGKENSTSPADWQLHVLGGIARSAARRFGTESIYEVHPTLRVYISDRIPLSELEIPAGIKLLQLADIRQRYVDAAAEGNDRAKERATVALERLDARTPMTDPEAAEYHARLKEIEQFVREQQNRRSEM